MTVKTDGPAVICPMCSSRWVWLMGVDMKRKTTVFIRMLCEDCGHRFAWEILDANSARTMFGVSALVFDWYPGQAQPTDRKLPVKSKQRGK